MEIRQILDDKRAYLPLLLLGDEQEEMIDRYLDRGVLYALEDAGRTLAVCVVTDEGGGVLEVKNLAVAPDCRRQGCGRRLLDFLAGRYRGQYRLLQVGTGESPLTLPFYEACGFAYSHRIPGFFTEHYDHPIVEAGVLLTDMVYLRRPL